jgi:hypothetical protein
MSLSNGVSRSTEAEYIAGIDRRDVAICIGLRRHTPQLESVMAVMAA